MLLSMSILILILIVGVSANEAPLIEISNGWLQGTHEKSYSGRTFSAFEGIPYARPPVGDLRFEAPKEVYNWTNIWIANTKHVCLQLFFTPGSDPVVTGQEDCLYINVYVPREKPDPSDNLNVIVHFHGGAFMLGSGHSYAGPKYLMDEEVIFVTMNYRLGPFGFLSTEDNVIPGNNGMKDQVLSLKWIQENIKHFGGNPDSVTITGASAGAASVHLHYFSPLSKGLFHRGFSESGTALNPWTIQEASLEKAKRLAMLVGCPSDTSRVIIDCLRTRSANKIAEVIREFSLKGFPIAPFAPVVEIEHGGAFLTEQPYKMLIEKSVTDVPWIAATAEQEGHLLALYYKDDFSKFLQDFETLAPYLLDYNYTVTENEKDLVSKRIRQQYFEETVNLDSLGRLFGDRLFIAGADAAARLQAKATKSPVYFYVFGYKGNRCGGEMLGKNADEIGASHGDSVLYYLYTPMSDAVLVERDEKMKSVFLQWLLSFADNQEPKIRGVDWKPVKGDNMLEYLFIRSPDDINMETTEDMGSNSFWNQLPLKENQNLVKIRDEL